MKLKPTLCGALAALALLSGCGGSDAPVVVAPVVPPVTPVEPPVIPPVNPPIDPDWRTLAGHCEHPRLGNDPATGLPYYEVQGTLTEEMRWLRSFMDDSYLWYDELPAKLNMSDYPSAVAYFAALKTPLVTASGRPKDRFHFTYPTAVWEAMSSSGVELSYGLTWSRATDTSKPRVWMVTMVEPGSPAAAAGLRRGDQLVSVDGVAITDTSDGSVDKLNAGLFPVTEGELHRLVLSRDGATVDASLKSVKLARAPVQNVKLIDTPTGKVGYLQFGEHNSVAESQLAAAFSSFKAAAVSDLVLDMRYNGGGSLGIASELAYMIAGPGPTAGKVFERAIYNDKAKPHPPQLFSSKAVGYISNGTLKPGDALPYLALTRVTVLTTPGTCSASESVINSLRGVDVEVNLIGGETCGKPYAFQPVANCGTTYFAIQFRGVNNKNFGDYADGFAPTCRVADDLRHALGDPAEGVLAAALNYRSSGACPVAPQGSRVQGGAMQLVRPEVKEISIRDR